MPLDITCSALKNRLLQKVLLFYRKLSYKITSKGDILADWAVRPPGLAVVEL